MKNNLCDYTLSFLFLYRSIRPVIKQSKKAANVSFKGDKPLEKFGRFSKIADVQDAPAMNEQVMTDSFPEATGPSSSRPEATVSCFSHPKATVPPQESANSDVDIDDDDTVSWPASVADRMMPHIDGVLTLYNVADRTSLEDVPETLSELVARTTKAHNPPHFIANTDRDG